ncbi:MAG TPA: TetR/AcrR family transcriptional regulator [Corynebacterium nuruki]|uniref:TetR/AcrR family transcriptional regulator n=1 Tax=Corynebacterium nuruki TaxID=1032851 RepID=A0A3D4SWV9_9CORY|nr:TetR/AcrR family transcriptional regulator [Corynebacterium nuruki]
MTDSRLTLLTAAADLIAANPGGEFSLRAVCDAAGVKLPTLYHFFGSKQGLVDAVVEHGFDMYVREKERSGTCGDPVGDIRAGWDAHVAFGLANPGFYTLMYGTVTPGHAPAAQDGPWQMLNGLTAEAQRQGRLVVPAGQAAAHILATNIGVTLRQIIQEKEDRALSVAVREGVIQAVTGTSAESAVRQGRSLVEFATAHPDRLGEAETRLFVDWVQRLL